MEIRPANRGDINAVGEMYDRLCDYLSEGKNYPGWAKGVYPTIHDAETAVNEQTMYVAADDGKILGTIILRHVPEEGYADVKWLTENDYSKIYVVYTLAVAPETLNKGIGKALISFALNKAKQDGCVSVRLDSVKGNIPAEKVYMDAGFTLICTKSLGYEEYGLPWYNLYEKIL